MSQEEVRMALLYVYAGIDRATELDLLTSDKLCSDEGVSLVGAWLEENEPPSDEKVLSILSYLESQGSLAPTGKGLTPYLHIIRKAWDG